MIDVSSPNYPQDENSGNHDMSSRYHSRTPLQTYTARHFFVNKTMHEIIPGVFLGSFSAANRNSLLENGINYIVCVREGYEAHFIKPQISDPTFTYLILDIADQVTENIIRFFPKVRQFIDEAMSNNCKVLVHGNNGNSRSATLVLAYIMEKFGLSSSDALNFVRQKRASVNPNEGFQAQLIEYEPIYKARQILANGQSSGDTRQKRKCEQLTETVDYNLIQRPPSPDLDNNNYENIRPCIEFSDHLYRLLKPTTYGKCFNFLRVLILMVLFQWTLNIFMLFTFIGALLAQAFTAGVNINSIIDSTFRACWPWSKGLNSFRPRPTNPEYTADNTVNI